MRHPIFADNEANCTENHSNRLRIDYPLMGVYCANSELNGPTKRRLSFRGERPGVRPVQVVRGLDIIAEYFTLIEMPRFRQIRQSRVSLLSALWVAIAFSTFETNAEERPDADASWTLSFRNDVAPVLTRAGCNMGACHGAQTGKGRLNLSLRGEDPRGDYETLRDSFVRDRDPDRSPMLRKPTLAVPHDGGERFDRDSESYQILSDWISQGAPFELPGEPHVERLEVTPSNRVIFEPEISVQLGATAIFSDGSTRDVNQWAIFEPSELNVEVDDQGLVTRIRPGETTVVARYLGIQTPARLAFVPERPDFVWADPPAYNYIDTLLQEKWRTLRLLPSDLGDDATFVRRAYLDLTGSIPTAEQAQEFVHNPDPAKRSALIDRLIETPDFASYWALKWADLLRVEEKVLDRQGVATFHQWLEDSIAQNQPIDQFARDILTALGSTYETAPANYYRALRQPDLRAEAVAQVFLGTRLGCAKCHNPPFEHWTMDDYYQFAAVFDGMDYEIIENKRFDKNDKNNFVGEQIVKFVDERSLKHPKTTEHPAPRFLGVSQPVEEPATRLETLGDWLTSPENPLFARVQINRIWASLMGRGIVEPVDDFRSTNPPVLPELLDALTADFVASGFNLRHAIRTICASRAYQLESIPNATNADDVINFTRNIPRRLEAEQLLDSIHQALGTHSAFEGYEEPLKAIELPGVQAVYRPKKPTHGDTFLKLFGKPPRLTNSDTERVNQTSLAQVFELTSGGTLNDALTHSDNLIGRLLDQRKNANEITQRLYWTLLARRPSREEIDFYRQYISKTPSRREAIEDLTWALLNSKEFLLRK